MLSLTYDQFISPMIIETYKSYRHIEVPGKPGVCLMIKEFVFSCGTVYAAP